MAVMKLKTDRSNSAKIEKSIRTFMETDEFKLTFPGTMDVNADATVSLLDYILGNKFVLGNKVPLEIMAKIAVAIFHLAKRAHDHLDRSHVFKTINEELLNNLTSERVTFKDEIKQWPKGLGQKSKFYFSLELKVHDGIDMSPGGTKNAKTQKGDYVVVTESGVYRWTYQYDLVKDTDPKFLLLPSFRKNLRSKERYSATVCEFIPMNTQEFIYVFNSNQELFLNLMHRVHQQMNYRQTELNRLSNMVSQETEKVWRMLSVLAYKRGK